MERVVDINNIINIKTIKEHSSGVNWGLWSLGIQT